MIKQMGRHSVLMDVEDSVWLRWQHTTDKSTDSKYPYQNPR